MGITVAQIVPDKIRIQYRELLRKKLNHGNMNQLKNDNFSIISSNCVGGVICHDLGKKFLSPTVNLWMMPEDFIKFCANLRHYSTVEPVECQDAGVRYPVGMVEDVKVYFMHYHSFEQAREKWMERMQRINWENLYFIMVERDGCTEEHMRRFDQLPYAHKVILTAQEHSDIPSAFHGADFDEPGAQVRDLCEYRGPFTGSRFLDGFDYVSFLNQTGK